MKVFVISLKRSEERRKVVLERFNELGLEFEFFDAIDGRAEPAHPLFGNYDFNKRLWLTSGRFPSKGELGCYASHYLLWQKCVELNEPILVVEDDSYIRDDIVSMFSLIKDKVIDYGFLRLEKESNKCHLFSKESEDNYQISFMSDNFEGTRSYAISPHSASLLISGSARWCMPVDNYIGSLYLHKMPSYILKPEVIENNPEDFDTTIQLGEENKAKWYRKPTRELYSLYRKFVMLISNKNYTNEK